MVLQLLYLAEYIDIPLKPPLGGLGGRALALQTLYLFRIQIRIQILLFDNSRIVGY